MPLARRTEPLEQPGAAPRSRPRAITADARPAQNAVARQHARLELSFAARSAAAPSYPGAVKLGLLVGAPLVLWSGIICGGLALFR